MTTNKYFDSSWNSLDNDIYADLVKESIQIHGRDFYYLPRELNDLNLLLGEDTTSSSFSHAIKIEMQLESINQWSGENQFISKFGLENHDEATLAIDRQRFNELVTSHHNNIKLPREGDLILFPKELDNRQRLFEITYVTPEPVFYSLGRLYYYQVTVRVFNHSHEEFNTGIKDIDDIGNNHSDLLTHTIKLDIDRTLDYYSKLGFEYTSDNIPLFQTGDIITHGKSFTSTVVFHNPTTHELSMSYNINDNGQYAMLDNRTSTITDIPLIDDNNNVWYILQDKKKTRQRKKSTASKGNKNKTNNELITNNNDTLIVCENNPLLN